MLEVEYRIKPPSKEDIEQMWKEMNYFYKPEEKDSLLSVIEIFKKNYGGKILFRSFLVSENTIFDWYTARNALDEIDFFEKFLSNKNILHEFEDEDFKGNLEFGYLNPLTFDGEIASEILFDVTRWWKGSIKELKELTMKFCFELFDDRYDEIWVYHSKKAWCTWFFDFIIDNTYIIID